MRFDTYTKMIVVVSVRQKSDKSEQVARVLIIRVRDDPSSPSVIQMKLILIYMYLRGAGF